MGTTTIKSTALDFQSIKSNLKTFLAQQDEFSTITLKFIWSF